MRLPFVSRALHEQLMAENARLRAELEHERSERQRAVDTMLANARLVPMHREEPARERKLHRNLPKRTSLVDVQRRLERQTAAPAEEDPS